MVAESSSQFLSTDGKSISGFASLIEKITSPTTDKSLLLSMMTKQKLLTVFTRAAETGFGANSFKDPSTWELVTDDLDEIMNIAFLKKMKEKEDREKFISKRKEQVEEINNLPKQFSTGIEFLDKKYAFERSDADFNPVYSSQIKGGVIRLKDITKPDERSYIYLDQFLTKDRKMQVKQFAQSHYYEKLSNEFPDPSKVVPKDLLISLINRQTELENEIKKIKRK